MFWRMTGLSTVSPVESILDKEEYTLEELLDEDETIQECKSLNSRLINFLRERSQVEQLLRYIVQEAPENAEKKHTYKFPFIACEIFTCEVDVILRTLVEDEELMNLLFSFLKPEHTHNTMLAGYFSKVVISLLLRKTAALMNYIQTHQDVFRQLVDLIGITSIMEVLIRLIGADEHIYANYSDAMKWLEDTHVLEMIVDKFSLSDSPEVHANAAEILCAITRYAPAGLVSIINSPSFVGRLFRHALEDLRPRSVLVHSLTVCISLLDPKRHVPPYHPFRGQPTFSSTVMAKPETISCMLDSLGDLLKLLDNSSSENTLPTSYGVLQPPLGKHRLKIVEFISVLLDVGDETAEKQLVQMGAIERVLDLFFEYPYNNFLHHYVENIIGTCLESKRNFLVEHLLQDCNILEKILEAEKFSTLSADLNHPTQPSLEKSLPRIGNIGHITRISNKLMQKGNNNDIIQTHMMANSEWSNWHKNVLLKRNALENVNQWACGRPTTRDSDDEDPRERENDVAALANTLSQALRYSIYNNNDIEEAPGSLEADDEDVYFDDDSAEVVISSLCLRDDQESSLFTNSNWFSSEEVMNERSTSSLASPSPNSDDTDDVVVDEDGELHRGTSHLVAGPGGDAVKPEASVMVNGCIGFNEESGDMDSASKAEEAPEGVEGRSATQSEVDLPSQPTQIGVDDHDPSEDIASEDACSVLEKMSSQTTDEELPASSEVQGSPECNENTVAGQVLIQRVSSEEGLAAETECLSDVNDSNVGNEMNPSTDLPRQKAE